MTPPALPPLPGVPEPARTDSRQPGHAPDSTTDGFLGILLQMLVGLGAEGKPALLPPFPGEDRSGEGPDLPETGHGAVQPEHTSLAEAASARPLQQSAQPGNTLLATVFTGGSATVAGLDAGEIAAETSVPGRLSLRTAPAPVLPAEGHIPDNLPGTHTPTIAGTSGDRTPVGTSPRGPRGESVVPGTTDQTPGGMTTEHPDAPPREARHALPIPRWTSGERMPEVTGTRSARVDAEGRSEFESRPEQGVRSEQSIRSEQAPRSGNGAESGNAVEPEHGEVYEKPVSRGSSAQSVENRDAKMEMRVPLILRGGPENRPAVADNRIPLHETPSPEGQPSLTAPVRPGIHGRTVVMGDDGGPEQQEPVLHLRNSVPPARPEEGVRMNGSTRAGGRNVYLSGHSGQVIPQDGTIGDAQDRADGVRGNPTDAPEGEQSRVRTGGAANRPSGTHQPRGEDGQTKAGSSGQPAGGEGQTDTRSEVRGTLPHPENASASYSLKGQGDSALPKTPVGRALSLPQDLARSVMDQVIKRMELHVDGNAAEMRIRLEPESLGEVGLRVRMSEGRMQAQIDVSQPAVKAVIELHLPQLRQALADQGINVERLDVFAHGESPSREASDGNAGNGKRRGGRDTGDREPDPEAFRKLGYNTIELVM